jgi:hypothetical protein
VSSLNGTQVVATLAVSMAISFDRDGLERSGFVGFVPVRQLREECYASVPRKIEGQFVGGIYLAWRDTSEPPRFLARNPGGPYRRDPTLPIAELKDRWVPGSQVIYIGKADATPAGNCLRTRVRAYLRYGASHRIAHEGGFPTWQLADSADLLIAWRVLTPDTPPLVVERAMRAAHRATYGKVPFANSVLVP